MEKAVVNVDRLSKVYRLGSVGGGTLREDLNQLWDWLFSRGRGTSAGSGFRGVESFWALRGVSFQVHQGEVLGVIGRNGAGKSTLLKLLSRITAPTEGRITIHGRVGSLLEVGTGFHPELTGLENIYLNGAILGMKRAEIRRKLDEIIEFAEVSRFIDTPVKRYSSGMTVRLAFAVAAHLEPEILIVDEVLAVGDAEFQRKCIGKMKEVSSGGRTVLFVSHNLPTLQALCTRAILLEKGEITASGPVAKVLQKYLSGGGNGEGYVNFEPLSGDTSLTKLELIGCEGSPVAVVDTTNACRIRLSYRVLQHIRRLTVGLAVDSVAKGVRVFVVNSSPHGEPHGPGDYQAELEIPSHLVTPGRYWITPVLHHPLVEMYDIREQAFEFEIVDTGSTLSHYGSADLGIFFLNSKLKIRPAEKDSLAAGLLCSCNELT